MMVSTRDAHGTPEKLCQLNLVGINVIEARLRIDILSLKVESSQSTPFAVLIPQV